MLRVGVMRPVVQPRARLRDGFADAPHGLGGRRQCLPFGVQVVDLRLMLLGELPPPALGEHLRHGVEQRLTVSGRRITMTPRGLRELPQPPTLPFTPRS